MPGTDSTRELRLLFVGETEICPFPIAFSETGVPDAPREVAVILPTVLRCVIAKATVATELDDTPTVAVASGYPSRWATIV